MYSLRDASDDDYEFLYKLNKITMMKYVEKIWGWEETVQKKFFKDKFSPKMYKIIVYEGKKDNGLCQNLRYDSIGAVSVSVENNGILIRIVEILPEYQNKGIGTKIINEVIAKAKIQNFNRVWLQVFKDNPARKSYDKLGFSVIKETETHYVMELKLKR